MVTIEPLESWDGCKKNPSRFQVIEDPLNRRAIILYVFNNVTRTNDIPHPLKIRRDGRLKHMPYLLQIPKLGQT